MKFEIIKNENSNDNRNNIEIEINKDVLNSFKRNTNAEQTLEHKASTSALSNLENINPNNISNINNSFIKDQSSVSFLSKTNGGNESNNLLSNIKLDRSRDNKDDNSYKFISLKGIESKEKVKSKVSDFQLKLNNQNNITLSNERPSDKSPGKMNTKTVSFDQEKNENPSLAELNNFNSLNTLSKQLNSQSPSYLSNKKVDEMKKNVLTFFGEKEKEEKKFPQKPKESIIDDFREKKSKIDNTYYRNAKKSEGDISSRSNTSDKKEFIVTASKANNNSNNRLKNRIEDFVKNIDKDTKPEILNKPSYGDYGTKKPSLLTRKPELEGKLNLSPKPEH